MPNTITRTVLDPAIAALEAELGDVELSLSEYGLADAIREGCTVTGKETGGWASAGNACALSSAFIAARARGYV